MVMFGTLLLGGLARTEAAAIEFTDLKPSQGFHFQKDQQFPVGFITSLTIGSTSFAADFSVTNPTNTAITMPVVAVLTSATWAGGSGDPLVFIGRLSTSNRATVVTLLHTTIQPQVQFSYQVFDYDPAAQVYYEAFGPGNNALLDGVLVKSGNSYELSTTNSPATDVTNPTNYVFSVSLAPAAIQQALFFATSSSVSVVKQWGINVTGSTGPPSVTTLNAFQISGGSATLQSSVNPGGARTEVYFEYGTSPSLTSNTLSATANAGNGSSAAPVNITVSGLAPQTTYYCRVYGYNSLGTSTGGILPFTTITPTISLSSSFRSGNFQLNFANVSNGLFSVRATTNVALPVAQWTDLGSATEIAPGQYQFTAAPTPPRRFYRVSSP